MGRALACFGADVGGRLDWTAKFPFRWNLGDEMDACSPWRVFNTESVAHRDAVESGASISSPEYSLQEARGRPLTVEANPVGLPRLIPARAVLNELRYSTGSLERPGRNAATANVHCTPPPESAEAREVCLASPGLSSACQRLIPLGKAGYI